MPVLTRCVGLLLALACAGSQAFDSYPGDAARVNGAGISYRHFIGVYQELQVSKGVAIGARGDQLPMLTRLRKEAMNLVIERELVMQAAEAQGVEVTEEEVQAAWDEVSEPVGSEQEFELKLETEGYDKDSYRTFLRRMLAAKKYLDGIRADAAPVSDEELETYYHDNERRLTLPEEVRVRHILLGWKPLGQLDDRAALREQLNAVREKALAGEDFAELAKEYSEDVSRDHGGDVGFFHRGEMVPAFEAAAFALQPDEISEIVETPYGVHILKLEDRRAERLLPLDEVREKLRDHISEEKMAAAVREETERLRQQAKVEILVPTERPQRQ